MAGGPMTTIRDCILSLPDVAYSADEIIRHVIASRDDKVRARDITNEIEQLTKERWLIHEMKASQSHYRRRSQAQWDALQAANNPNQGRLI